MISSIINPLTLIFLPKRSFSLLISFLCKFWDQIRSQNLHIFKRLEIDTILNFEKIEYIIKVRNCLKFKFIHFITQSEKYWALKTKSTKMDNQNFLILVIKVGVTYPKIWFKNWKFNLYIFDLWFNYWKNFKFFIWSECVKIKWGNK